MSRHEDTAHHLALLGCWLAILAILALLIREANAGRLGDLLRLLAHETATAGKGN